VSNLYIDQSDTIFEKLNFYFIKTANKPPYGHIAVYENILLCLSKNRLYTIRIHLFDIFIIKTPQLGLLMLKTLTNVLYYNVMWYFSCLLTSNVTFI